MTVFRTNVFLPCAVVAEKISKAAAVGTKCQPEKSQVTAREVEMVCAVLKSGTVIKKSGHDKCPRVVVGGIALARVWHREDGVLQHAGVVGHGVQMIGVQN